LRAAFPPYHAAKTPLTDLKLPAARFPVLPEYVESISDDAVVLKNYAGKRFVYRQPGAAEGEPPTGFEPVLVG
jgi:hypothetical protein